MTRPDDLLSLDRALRQLRRMWDAPAGIAHEGRVIEGSTLLVCLAVDEHDGVAGVGTVATTLGVAHSTASRLVARAAEAGMLLRRRADDDPRRASLALTPDGERFVAASRDFRRGRLDALLADWPDRDVAALGALLTRFAAAVTDGQDDGPTGDPR